jgi:hypothetical protein
VRKRLLLLIVEFLVITVPLGWLWVEWGRTLYLRVFVKLGTPIFTLIGVTQLKAQLVIDHFINYVPFLVLMVITPTLSLRRRSIGTVVGFIIIFLGHVLLASVAFVASTKYGETEKAFTTLFPAFLFNDSLPFILWAIISAGYLKKMFTGALGKSRR